MGGSSSNNPTTPKISIRREGCSVVDSETSDSETTTEPNTMTHTMTHTTTLTITHNYETSDSETTARSTAGVDDAVMYRNTVDRREL